jgi:hypothetical protein
MFDSTQIEPPMTGFIDARDIDGRENGVAAVVGVPAEASVKVTVRGADPFVGEAANWAVRGAAVTVKAEAR